MEQGNLRKMLSIITLDEPSIYQAVPVKMT